jgi:hypothetical protein
MSSLPHASLVRCSEDGHVESERQSSVVAGTVVVAGTFVVLGTVVVVGTVVVAGTVVVVVVVSGTERTVVDVAGGLVDGAALGTDASAAQAVMRPPITSRPMFVQPRRRGEAFMPYRRLDAGLG